MKRKTFLLFILIGITLLSNAQKWSWAKNFGGSTVDIGNCIAADAQGNVYIGGYFNSSFFQLGSTPSLTNKGNFDVFIAKIDPAGNCLWSNSAGGTLEDGAKAIAVDNSGNVYLTGKFASATIMFGATTLTNKGGEDIFLAKYDATGNFLWAKNYGGTANEAGLALSTDATGNIYLCGSFYSPSVSFEQNIIVTNTGNTTSEDIFYSKFDASGNCLWAKSSGNTTGNKNDAATSIYADKKGSVYIAGYFDSESINIGSNKLTNAGVEDMFITKYDEAGNCIWAKGYGGTDWDYANGIMTDPWGYVYITGGFSSTTLQFDSKPAVTNKGIDDIFTAKFTSAGVCQWVATAGGTDSDIANGLTVDIAGNIYITGGFKSPSMQFSTNPTLTNKGLNDIFFAYYSDMGVCYSSQSYGGTNEDACYALTSDNLGNVYMVGFFGSNPLDINGNTINSKGQFDILVTKYDPMLVGVSKIDRNNNANIYPNPAKDVLNITAENNSTIKIYSISGQLVKQFTSASLSSQVNISDLKAGIYTIEVSNDREVKHSKFIKE